jgi:undecaprenol kinase
VAAKTHKNQAFLTRLRFALAGLAHGFRTERSLRTQALALLAIFVVLLVVRPAAVWWALVVLAGAAVLAAEFFNTALEHLTDHLHPQVHAQIRIVKDCAAAAVLCVALGALAVGLALLIDRLRR